MKRVFTILLLLAGIGAYAQVYNNEWIDFSKTYYKFKVGADGVYRIPQSVLAAAGLGNVNAQSFQLFRNGKEVPIYTTVAGGPLGSTDYIEFWGHMNDGEPDNPLYRSPAYQHTKHWSLESDTAFYFLTVNTTGTPFHITDAANNVAGNSLPAEPYFLYKAGNYFRTGGINPGFAANVGEYIYSSSYDIGEWWSSTDIYPGGPLADNLSNLFVYAGGPDATLNYGMAGCADDLRRVQLSVNNAVLVDSEMDSFYDLKGAVTVPNASIAGGAATVQFINNSTVGSDRMRASFYELTYPRQFNFGGQSNFYFELAAKSAGYFLQISNFNVSGSATPILYDLSSGARYTAVVGTGNVLSFALPGSASTRKMVLVNEDPSTISTVTGLTMKNFVNFTNSAVQGNYLIISNPVLYTSATSAANPVVEYQAYRSSAAGGSWDAQIYDVNELIDQFGFGIKKNPLAIQNFLRYARNVFAIKPQYVFLIGHGMDYSTYEYYGEQAHNPLADGLNLVPTYGYPASDNKLSAGNPVDAAPVTPIGRLSVVSGAEIEIYLAKVVEYEQAQAASSNTVAGRAWMKNVVHVTGASEPYLGTILCNDMSAYQQIISDTLFGAKVTTFCKVTADQVQQVTASSLSTLFNTGLGILTYFGHSSNTTLGYNLDDPSDYSNAGKYPVFFVDGCDAGDFFVYDAQRFSTSKTLSELYVLAKERGSIAFVASTHYGIVNYLNIYLSNLYQNIARKDYGKSLGITEADALQGLMNAAPGDFYARLHAEEMTLHGDPSLKFDLQTSLPDYDIEASQVQINPTFVAVSNNSFTVTAHFYNLGKAVNDSISVSFTRKYPNGTSAVIATRKIPGILYDDTLQLVVPIIATRDKGQNYITVVVNSTNTVPEVTLANNTATAGVYIYEDGANPAYPYNYAIINTPTQKLYASTADPLSPSAQYVMQIDTTTLFNSAAMVSRNLTSIGGELEFDPGITYKDSVVYYWRVAKVPAAGSPYTWNGFSFVYIDPSSSLGGSNQSHFYQHTQSTPNGMALDTAGRTWQFTNIVNTLYIRNGVYPTAATQADDNSVSINGDDSRIQAPCGISEIIFNVINPYTFSPWYNGPTGSPGQYGSQPVCGDSRSYDFIYNILDTNQRRNAMQFLDLIPNGYYVVVWNLSYYVSSTNTYASTWAGDTSYLGSGNSMYQRLKDQGFTNIDSFNAPRAFIFLYQKNNQITFTPKSVFSNGISDKITLAQTCYTPDTLGIITSPSFGPAKQWHELHWRGYSLESPSTDSVALQVLGVDTSGNTTPLYQLSQANQDYTISGINAAKYPYVQLKMSVRDTIHATPYQLKYWRVTYDPVPEGALAPNIYLSSQDTLQVGQPLNFGIAFKNISPTPFSDSMRFTMTVTDKNNAVHTITIPKGKVLVSGDTLSVNYKMDTKNYPGQNTLYLDVNPNYAQPEQYTFNNFLYKTFYVKYDTRNPLMDVTFDNTHILNGDIVSARPHIQIKLKSPSQYLLLADTSLIKVQVIFPDGTTHSYSYSSDTLRFTPATSVGNNTATVDFAPSFSTQVNPQGDNYQLIVTGQDESGNTITPYRVGFTVITKPMISNVMNYPNPFSTSTAFVFTLTGIDVPQNMKIQILTITGKIVREITKEELGPLHIGRNITEFKWNGTDMYGSRLANGVYLYHVVTNLDGKSLGKYQSSGDNTNQYFNNGYGKMYLMR
ncbi:MAG: C25 family cysteine peptidase [Puia sp.]|nr:C25 family cysteine peptidase [Puia sp.]